MDWRTMPLRTIGSIPYVKKTDITRPGPRPRHPILYHPVPPWAIHTCEITGRRRDTGMAGGMAIQSKTAYLMTDLNLASHL